jgi:xylan 1,4-beta-xylosidase
MHQKVFFVLFFSFLASASALFAQSTYCNPINLDYGFTPIPNFSEWGRHRATADPVIVNYKGDYYLFSTNQWGYWWSKDLSKWTFVARHFLRPEHKVYDDLCAPAVGIIGDTMLVFGSTYSRTFPIWMSTNPKANEWSELVHKFDIGGWDPDFFTDQNGKLYMFSGSSNAFPLKGVELDRKTMQPLGTRTELFILRPERYGWQRFGEHLDNTFLNPFMEGAHVTQYKGKYYLQYGAPGTEFSGYSDGVAVATTPLTDAWEHQSDPLSSKAGGFIRGAGHGATFQDNWQNYWHVSTMVVAVKNNFERRIGIWPAGFDQNDVMYCNTAFGDYPHYLPNGKTDHLISRFTGWMLLNYQKPVRVSSTLGAHYPNMAVDESVKTYWSARSANPGEWLESDLGDLCGVRAIQVNFADQDADILGKGEKLAHQYVLYHSKDGKKWEILVDKSQNQTDVPHDYIELPQAIETRYIKIENRKMASGKFALSGLRVFGKGKGNIAPLPKQFFVLRTEADKRSAWIKWSPVDQAYAYNIYYGTAPDKLYNCIMVHDANEYWFKSMDRTKTYYFSIESVNENGVSERSAVQKVE